MSKTYASLTNMNHKNNQQITQTSSQCDKAKFLFTHFSPTKIIDFFSQI